ncbi:spore cortex biosynthesis protein YabQ [Fictibacillus sp. KU28468]|uniref:spore cortex biosynthesis protein YabQ n=1 Tax=Fictibacillus sp. KU28468 TaxID=2991053 RepID=UPI00223E6BE4|nr:spore cortex biosynthesis protein YabQ [Fictibacillus sp. KU28468]UZJ78940.1 spore cortex biosynthesis protein YabQ [Fictibacillus sp. KU28468]
MTLSVQFQTMLSMAAMGIWIGMAIDTYGRFVHERRKWYWLHFINDLIFWLLQALIVFYVLLHVNHANLRLYIFAALLCGFSFYKALLQTGYKRVLEVMIRIVTQLFRFFVRLFYGFIIKPVKWVISIILAIGILAARWVWAIVFTLLKIVFSPIKWLFRLISRFIPKQTWYNLKGKWLKKAGILISLKNTVKNWFRKQEK